MTRGKTNTRTWKPLDWRTDYLVNAAYFWYRAVGEVEGLASALHRMQADHARKMLEKYQIPVPDAWEVYEFAKRVFPAEQLHDAPGERGIAHG